MRDKLKVKGLINLKVYRDGKLIDERKVKNTITNAGLGETTNLMGNVATPAYFTYLAVGIGTTAATAANTALESEIVDSGLVRAGATVTQETTTVANDTLQLMKSWTVTAAKAVTECGILNAASVGDLLGRQVFAAINVTSGDTLQVTYQVALS